MTKIKLDIDAELYEKYKQLCERRLLKVTAMNKKLIEEAMRQFLQKEDGED